MISIECSARKGTGGARSYGHVTLTFVFIIELGKKASGIFPRDSTVTGAETVRNQSPELNPIESAHVSSPFFLSSLYFGLFPATFDREHPVKDLTSFWPES